MPEPRGSSWNTAAPVLDAPGGDDEGILLVSDDAPTRIKRLEGEERSAVSVLSESDRELIGASLDHFELLDCIGAGGMGRVFRARDSRLDRLVALKVLDPALARDEEICRRFEQEARAAARLDDPHFAHVYYYGFAKGLHFIAMEFVAGENWRKRIDRLGRLDVASVVDVGLQIARGLHHAASCGVIHRDIKPSNIIVTPHGLAKLVDMGLARDVLQSSSSQELTHPGVTLGTFDYISPEQARDPRAVDVRSDIYSLGCTLYHALTGRPPFPDGAGLQKLLQHQSDEVQDPRHFAPDLPESLVAVLQRMMAKDPADRYQTPAALIRDLGAIAQWLDLPYAAVEPGYADVVGLGEKFWERQLVWVVPMLLFLTAVGIYSFAYRGEEMVPTPPAVASAPLPAPPPAAAPTVSAPAPPRESAPARASTVAGETNKIVVVTSGAELRDKIATAEPDSIIELDFDEYALPSENGAFRLGTINRNLVIRSRRNLTTLHIDAGSAGGLASAGPVLTVAGGNVQFQNLRFSMRIADGIGETPYFLLLEGGTTRLDACDFQVFGGRSTTGALVVLRPGLGPSPCQLIADRCHLAGPADGIQLAGPGEMRLSLSNCAFRPFAHAVRWDGGVRARIALQQVSMLSSGAPLFSFARVHGELIRVSNSVFSCLQTGTLSRPPVIVAVDRAASDPEDEAVWWRGERNLFHGFDDAVVDFGGQTRVSLAEAGSWGFDETIETRQFAADEESPWEQPLEFGARQAVDSDPLRPFRLSSRTLAVLKKYRYGQTGIGEGPAGALYTEIARETEPRRADAEQPAPPPQAAPATPVFVVDPSAVDSPRPAGVYRHLATACREAGSGQTIIELRTNGPIDEQDVLVQRNLVLRPAPGYRPRLRLRSPNAGETAAARLFRLEPRARLRIERIPMTVEAAPDLISAGVVLFDCAEGARVDLADLWVQLGRESAAGIASVFAVRTPPASTTFRNGMPLEETRVEPVLLTLSRCGVRSSGAMLTADPAGYWSLNVENSYVFAQKPAVGISGPAVALGQTGQNVLEVAGSTFVLRDAFVAVAVDGAQPENPRFITASATHCVFLGLGVEPFTRSAGAHSAAIQQESITWTGAENFVAGYDTIFRYERPTDGMMRRIDSRPFDSRAWLDYWKLPATSFRFGPATLPDSIKATTIVPTPEDLRIIEFPVHSDVEIGVDARLLPPDELLPEKTP